MFEARIGTFGYIAEMIERGSNRFEAVADGKKQWGGVVETAGEKITGNARLEEDPDILAQLRRVIPAVVGTITVESTSPRKNTFFLTPSGEVLVETGMWREGPDGVIKHGKLYISKALSLDDYLRGAKWSQPNPTAQESS